MIIRFIAFLLRRDYEDCKGCEVYKTQIKLLAENNKQLQDTLLGLLQPKIVPQVQRDVMPFQARGGLWSRRKKEFEEQDRLKAKAIKDSDNIGLPDGLSEAKVVATTVEDLESELEIDTEVAILNDRTADGSNI